MSSSPQGLGRGLDALLSRKKIDISPPPPPPAAAAIPGVTESIIHIPVDDLLANDYQPRLDFDEGKLAELAESIKQYGVIQPLVVMRQGDGYLLIAGERRLRASKLAGLPHVPAVIRDSTQHERLAIALIENVQRVDLNPIELALGYKRLRDEFNLTQGEIGKRVSKSRPGVTNIMRLLNLPPEVQDALRDRRINENHAKHLMSLTNPAQQIELMQRTVDEGWIATQLEHHLKSINHVPKIIFAKNPLIADAEDRLRSKLGTRIVVVNRLGKGSITIKFYSEEQLNELVDTIAGT